MVYSKNDWWVHILTLSIAQYQKQKKNKKKTTTTLLKFYYIRNYSEEILTEEQELEYEKLATKAAKISFK